MRSKVKKTEREKRRTIALIVVFVLIAGILTAGFISTTMTASGYAGQLENVYQRSFYELISNVNDLETNLSKSLISSNKTAQEKNLYKVWQQCDLCASNISRLPLNHNSIDKTTKLVNQLGGFSYYLLEKVKNNQEITEGDYSSLNELHSLCLDIQKTINDYANSLSHNYSILKDVKFDNNSTGFSSTFVSMQDSSVEYPTLIYDGPFSDSTLNKKIKGLNEKYYSVDEAELIIKEGFSDYAIKSIDYLGSTKGKFETYNFQLTSTKGKEIYIQITKKGGKILTVSSYANTTEKNLDLEGCMLEAEEFAKKLNFEDVKAVWGTVVENVAYINLTAMANDVIIYPDMIKVKVAMDSGEVVGWEACAYCYNHIERNLEPAKITKEQARAKVLSSLNVEDEKLAIIPIEFGEEKLCYEFKATKDDATFYVYINAQTGEEENILKVIKTDNGELLM